MAVTPNFHIVDLPGDVWARFLHSNRTPWERVSIIRAYISALDPTKIREIAWIPLSHLNEYEIDELRNAIL